MGEQGGSLYCRFDVREVGKWNEGERASEMQNSSSQKSACRQAVT